ncbi:PilW family protein [Gemmatimonadota bacterium]
MTFAARDRSGFTLLEALVAMVLSTVVVALVASVFLIQNGFYSDAVRMCALQENVRGAVSLVSTQLRGVTAGGIVAAEADSVTFRVPLVVGGVCGVNGSETYLLLPTDGEGIDAADVSGYAVRDDTGAWTYTGATWGSIFHSSGSVPAQVCALTGADTTGAKADFYRLDGLVASPSLQPGAFVMLYREMSLRLGTSDLDPGTTALFAGQAGTTLTEFASGLTPGSSFEYRLPPPDHWQSKPLGLERDRIFSIRFSALGAAESSYMGRDSLTFDLTVTVLLRNVN